MAEMMNLATLGKELRRAIDDFIKNNDGNPKSIHSYADLAEKLGYSRSYLTLVFKGKRRIRKDTLKHLCEIIHTVDETQQIWFGFAGYEYLSKDNRDDLPTSISIEDDIEVPEKGILPKRGKLRPGSRLPFEANKVFTGRIRDLKVLSELLLYGHEAETLVINKKVVLGGLSGVGKTQLAIEYCKRYGNSYQGVHWILASGNSTIESEIIKCGEELHIKSLVGTSSEQVIVTIGELKKGRRLVILNNLEDIQLLRDWLPLLEGINVLITSRRINWPIDLGISVHILDILSESESIELLYKLAPRLKSESKDDLSKLVNYLGHLPLALDLAGRFLQHNQRLNLSEFLTKLDEEQNLLDHVFLNGNKWDDDGSPTANVVSVIAAFNLSWKKLEEIDTEKRIRDTIARKLFLALGWCEPNFPIPHELIENLVSEWDDGTILVGSALQKLYDLGLLSPSMEGPVFHPLLSLFAKRESKLDMLSILSESLYQVTDQATASLLPARFISYLPHLRYVASEAEKFKEKKAGALWCNLGSMLRIKGDFKEAQEYLERGVYIEELTNGFDSVELATWYSDLGQLLGENNKIQEAKDYYNKAYNIWSEKLGEGSTEAAVALNGIGMLYLVEGNLTEARNLFERTLLIWEKNLDENHVYIASVLSSLGDVLSAQNEHERAIEILERSIYIFDHQPDGTTYAEITSPLNNLCKLFFDEGNYKKAKELALRALRIDEFNYGKEHYNVAIDLHNLGGILDKLNNLKDAQRRLERALAIWERTLPEGHPLTERTRSRLQDVIMRSTKGKQPV